MHEKNKIRQNHFIAIKIPEAVSYNLQQTGAPFN